MRTRLSPSQSLRRVPAITACLVAGALLAIVAGCPGGKPPAAQPATNSGSGAANSPAAPYVAEKKIDPIKENGKIFEGWQKPKFTLVFTGEQHGYFEPCGCAGPGRQKGGMSRRDSFIKQLTADGWNPVPIDLGGLSRRYGQQAEIKLSTSIDALKLIGYQAIGVGGDDLRFPADFLLSAMGGDERFLSANVAIHGTEMPFRVIEVAGVKIGVTSVLAGKYKDDLSANLDPGITISDPVAALETVVPQLKEAGCTQMILLAYAPADEAQKLAKQFSDFTYVLAAGGPDEPPTSAAEIPGSTAKLIQVGHKGMFAVAIGVYDDGATKYQRIPLDSRFPNSPEMHELMVGYQDQLKTLGWEGLGISASLHPRAKGADDPNARYVGADACGKCHAQAYSVWKGSKHAHATETLVKADPPRQFDPECIACHATGWDAEHYSPYTGGYASIAETSQLANNSCENCHGPGSGHVVAEAARDPKQREEMRALMRLNLAVAEHQTCNQCHDLDNSPDFNFKTYWDKIKHPGKK